MEKSGFAYRFLGYSHTNFLCSLRSPGLAVFRRDSLEPRCRDCTLIGFWNLSVRKLVQCIGQHLKGCSGHITHLFCLRVVQPHHLGALGWNQVDRYPPCLDCTLHRDTIATQRRHESLRNDGSYSSNLPRPCLLVILIFLFARDS